MLIYVASKREVPRELSADLNRIVRDGLRQEELKVLEFAVRSAWPEWSCPRAD